MREHSQRLAFAASRTAAHGPTFVIPDKPRRRRRSGIHAGALAMKVQAWIPGLRCAADAPRQVRRPLSDDLRWARRSATPAPCRETLDFERPLGDLAQLAAGLQPGRAGWWLGAAIEGAFLHGKAFPGEL